MSGLGEELSNVMIRTRLFWGVLLAAVLVAIVGSCTTATGPVPPVTIIDPSVMTLAVSQYQAHRQQPLTFTLTAVRLKRARVLNWNWGDGTPDESTLITADSFISVVQHTYTTSGTFVVNAMVYDSVIVSNYLATVTIVVDTISAIPGSHVEMVQINGGEFIMGSNANGGYYDSPAHQVRVSPFSMSKFEVTQSLWKKVMDSLPGVSQSGDSIALNTVGWYSIPRFCNMLSRLEGLQPCYSGAGNATTCDWTANGYRLPTEAEWEFAARAGTTTAFYTGPRLDTLPKDRMANVDEPNLDLAGWYKRNANDSLHMPGRKKPNAFGLYDMLGNAGEMVWDWFDSTYYQISPSIDPTGPATGTQKIERGGDFVLPPGACTVTARPPIKPENSVWQLGFRIVRRP
jgi:formylglycine-generating enzyme required for sulfatase activity